MLFLLSPYFYSLYLFIVFIHFISYVGLFVLGISKLFLQYTVKVANGFIVI
jgi:hypothetical protein